MVFSVFQDIVFRTADAMSFNENPGQHSHLHFSIGTFTIAAHTQGYLRKIGLDISDASAAGQGKATSSQAATPSSKPVGATASAGAAPVTIKPVNAQATVLQS